MDHPAPVDALLEEYLGLLDEYTTLRTELATLQSNMYQHIARANFSAERGLRYGQDHYDDRMQALRRVQIAWGGSGAASFSVSKDWNSSAPSTRGQESPDAAAENDSESPETKDTALALKDPLQWFGILTPMPLRLAQSNAVEAVEQLVPRLASLSARMSEVEIQVRRARKKRARAEAAEKKQGFGDVSPEEVAV